MTIWSRVAEIATLARNGQGNLQMSLKALTGLTDDLTRLKPSEKTWIERKETATIFDAVFASLEGRDPAFSAKPRNTLERRVQKSHPRAFSTRMNNLVATAAGRALVRMAPYLAVRDMESVNLSGQDYKSMGLTYRKQVAFFASLLASPEGRAITRLAAKLAQDEWSQRFWDIDDEQIQAGHLIVGNGPVGVAFAHSLIESGTTNGILVSESEPGGPFSWGNFPVNHRSRPMAPGVVGAPAGSWALDDLGPVLVAPSDISTSWGYAKSDIIAAATALNALAAGPMIRARVTEYLRDQVDDDSNEIVMQLEDPDSFDTKQVRFVQTTFATGLGNPNALPGYVSGMSVQEFLGRPDPSALGKTIAIVGDGDSAMMSIAHALGLSDSGSTPRQVQGLEQIVWIRSKGEVHKETFPIVERLRYADIAPFLPRLLDAQYPHGVKVLSGRLVESDTRGGKIMLRYVNDQGSNILDVDVIINATGFDGDINTDFDRNTGGEVIYSNGIPVARRLLDDHRVYAIGAAAQLPVSNTEKDLYPILRNEKLSQNTVALFRTIPAAVAFGRMSTDQVTGEQARKKLVLRKEDRQVSSDPPRMYEDALYTEASTRMSSHAMVLSRMRYLVATFGQDVECPQSISIEIEMRNEQYLTLRSKGEVPSPVIGEVLQPLFEDDAVRGGLATLMKTALSMEETAADILREEMPSRVLTLNIPADNNRLMPQALALAA